MTEALTSKEPTPSKGLGQNIVYPTPGQVMRMRMRRHKGFIAGAICVILIFLMAVFAPLLTPVS